MIVVATVTAKNLRRTVLKNFLYAPTIIVTKANSDHGANENQYDTP